VRRVGGAPIDVTDGVVTLRAATREDTAALIAGRDEEFHTWMGPGDHAPMPTACVIVEGAVVGWVDAEQGHPWLDPDEVNVGYALFAPHRGCGYASRAVQLLGHHLATRTEHRTMSLMIDPANTRSVALADRLGFARSEPRVGQPPDEVCFVRAVPSVVRTDGVVTIRPLGPDDLDADLEAKDDEQIEWLWLPGQREQWEAMAPEEQREHARRGLEAHAASFGSGPKWTFAADVDGSRYVAYVDCDLANDHVPAGEANISYSAHPAHRGNGYVSRAVRLVVGFVADNTAAREAHVIVDARNVASLWVARSLGAVEAGRLDSASGEQMIRHIVPIDRRRNSGPS
jgi:RimJ/RimL family protein N-acetyltransferase